MIETPFQQSDVRDTISYLFPDNKVFEICTFNKWNKVLAGWFGDKEKAIKEVERIARDPELKAVYITLNPCHEALLSRSYEEIKQVKSRTSDREITCLRHLLIDIDPTRPADTNSTDEEHDLAIETAKIIRTDLKEQGWTDPLLFADSGNGAQLIYKLPDMPNTPENVELVKRTLQALAQQYDNEQINIDQKVFNPARITKLFGTFTRKGDTTPERPCRVSSIIRDRRNGNGK